MLDRDQRIQALRDGKIANAVAIVNASEKHNRPLLSRCVALVENETSGIFNGVAYAGGLNIFGHEGSFPAIYGQVVLEQRYKEYESRISQWGLNGVGLTQLTNRDLQIEADKLGGCWVAEFNCDVGFRFLHELIEKYGVRGGYMHYNGSGPAAEAYANRAFARQEKWSKILDEGIY